MFSKSDKPGLLGSHFESKTHEVSVLDFATFTCLEASLPYSFDSEKRIKDIEAKKERERNRENTNRCQYHTPETRRFP